MARKVLRLVTSLCLTGAIAATVSAADLNPPPQKAVVAVAHALLRVVYHVLADGTAYREAGATSYDRRHTQRVTRRASRRLSARVTT